MFILFSLIVMRMSGAIALNPILGRSNVPARFKASLVLVISLMLYIGFEGNLQHVPVNMVEYGVMLIKELLLGLTLGFSMELTLLIVRFASAIMDFSMGLSMAQIYDPESHAQMTVTSGMYYAFLVLLFFAVNGHIRLIGIFFSSGVFVPFGEVTLSPELSMAMLHIFQECVLMGLQFAFPLVAMELVAETAVGILMRVIPQINVFVVNFQVKIIVGMMMLVFLFSPMADKLYVMLDDMFASLMQLLMLMR